MTSSLKLGCWRRSANNCFSILKSDNDDTLCCSCVFLGYVLIHLGIEKDLLAELDAGIVMMTWASLDTSGKTSNKSWIGSTHRVCMQYLCAFHHHYIEQSRHQSQKSFHNSSSDKRIKILENGLYIHEISWNLEGLWTSMMTSITL